MSAVAIIGYSILFLIASFTCVYLFRKVFGKKPVKGLIYNKNKLPHENYPEIIEWEDGDQFKRETYWDDFSLIDIYARVKSISHDGVVVIDRSGDESGLKELHISKFIKGWTNNDLKNLRKNQREKDILSIIDNDQTYNKFLNDYRAAFKEIRS